MQTGVRSHLLATLHVRLLPFKFSKLLSPLYNSLVSAGLALFTAMEAL